MRIQENQIRYPVWQDTKLASPNLKSNFWLNLLGERETSKGEEIERLRRENTRLRRRLRGQTKPKKAKKDESGFMEL